MPLFFTPEHEIGVFHAKNTWTCKMKKNIQLFIGFPTKLHMELFLVQQEKKTLKNVGKLNTLLRHHEATLKPWQYVTSSTGKKPQKYNLTALQKIKPNSLAN